MKLIKKSLAFECRKCLESDIECMTKSAICFIDMYLIFFSKKKIYIYLEYSFFPEKQLLNL